MQEKRFFNIELRARDNERKLVGYPAKFNRLSEDLGGFREKIAPGAFKKSLKTADVRALFDHDSKFVLGRTRSKTLALVEDNVGLKMSVQPPNTAWADDLMESVARGDISQMSFGFRTVSDSWRQQKGEHIRTLEEVDLFDVSVVTYPAYPDTEVAMRAFKKYQRKPGRATSDPERGDFNATIDFWRGKRLGLKNFFTK